MRNKRPPSRGGRLLTALAIVFICFAALNWIAKPYKLWCERVRESRGAELEILEAQKKLEAQLRLVERLKTNEGMEEEARRQGWTKKDEVPVILAPERPRKRGR